MGKKHQAWKKLEPFHQKGKKQSGKGCVWRHQGRKDGNECSHQWQSHEKAKKRAESRLYNWPKYESLAQNTTYKTGSRETKKKNRFPPGHAAFLESPAPKAWDVNRGQNFKNYLRPYWHNAHHLIPNGTFHNIINKRCGKNDPGLAHIIKAGLMQAGYNLSDKENMMILPMGKAVSTALGLPRHLRGDEAVDGKKNFFNHPDYNKYVKSMLTPIINEYKKLAKKARQKEKDHELPPVDLNKEKLERLSECIRKMIKTKANNGASLDEVFQM